MSGLITPSILGDLSVNDSPYNAVVSEIGSNSDSLIPQPVMIIGQEGSGKTTLLKRIFDSDICRDRPKIWIDGRCLFSSDDIISGTTSEAASILFIDDMDFYLTRCTYDEQFRLRRFLYNEGAPMMIGSVSKVLPAMTEYDAPFFEGLKNVYLHTVSPKMLTKLLDEHNAARAYSLMSLLSPTIKSLQTVCDILALNDIPDKDTSILVSMFSDRYRLAYQSLPTYSQHILNAFPLGITPLTIPELREKTGLSTNILTAYLKSLGTAGIIRIDRSIKRRTKYRMSDPLFQLWLTQSRHP